MNRALNLIWLIARTYFLNQAVNRLKVKGTLIYLRFLQGVRQTLRGAIAIFVVLQLMVMGFIGCIVSGVLLIPINTETKLWIFFGLSAAFFVIPLAFLLFVFSEKLWFKMSGAQEIVNQSINKT
jgi:hypothetical protein